MALPSESSADLGGNIRPSADSVPRHVLEEILNRTAQLGGSEQGIHASDLDLLIEVARRFRGVEFQLDPIVIELVRVTLPRQLKNSVQSDEQFAAIVDRVARTLFENPDSEKRLRSLWELLSAVE